MDTTALENIGLSKAEIKVFIAILELGESKAGKIIAKTGLQSSSVHNAINSLLKKGFISYIKKGKIKFYNAISPESILNYMETKKRELLKILPELKLRHNKSVEENVELYKFYSGIKSMLFELIKDAKKGDIYKTFAVEDPEQYEKSVENVYKTIKQISKEKRLIMRGIFHENVRKKKSKSSLMKKKYVNFPLPPNTIILNDKIAIISWDDEPSGILIHSKSIARHYDLFFEHLWKTAKKK